MRSEHVENSETPKVRTYHISSREGTQLSPYKMFQDLKLKKNKTQTTPKNQNHITHQTNSNSKSQQESNLGRFFKVLNQRVEDNLPGQLKHVLIANFRKQNFLV